MNAQTKYKNGFLIRRGIEYCSHTWNVIGGCEHDCQWTMPDGSTAICYAKETAEGVASPSYPQGFEHHYYHPARLAEPLTLKEPARIFLDSMSDLMGRWVPPEQIEAVLNVCRQATWHTFLLLTKNAPRLRHFNFPDNVHVGVSMPPDRFRGQPLSYHQQTRMLEHSLNVLSNVGVPVRWMSFEPLSWDVSHVVAANPPLQWAVIGAASNGNTYYQPDPAHVARLLEVLDAQRVPVFFKGNLAWNPHREFLPGFLPTQWNTFPQVQP